MPDREKLRALTPEQRMRAAVRAAYARYANVGELVDGSSDIIAHGAAEIEAALAEQRARTVAYGSEMAKRLNEISAETVRKGLDSSPDILAAKMVEQLVCAIREGEPRAWAERTGWKMEETGDDEDS